LKNRFVILAIVVIVIIAGFFIFGFGDRIGGANNSVPISQVLKEAAMKPSPIREIQIGNNTDTVRVRYNDGTEKLSRRETATTDFTTQLANVGYDFANGPDVKVNEASGASGILSLLTFLLPTLLFIGVLVFMMRQAQGGNNQALGFG